ncbi:L-lactate dehydrogenase 2 [Mycolicibacterium chubuense]|uniref:L-lactate dehydrogenase 2 n=1 Tax=Mycolicibacterium chubuense TaxID=1800 RepID=A0A0J6VHH7_MYCCU|nr:L-lactate dehydrogenase 2 [Mycolicibacterium chubuense]
MAHRTRARHVTVLAAVLAVVGVLGLTSCSQGAAESVDYAVDGTLITYNTNTVAGAASGGPQAFARVLTGFNYHGPDGQIVGDHDFVPHCRISGSDDIAVTAGSAVVIVTAGAKQKPGQSRLDLAAANVAMRRASRRSCSSIRRTR